MQLATDIANGDLPITASLRPRSMMTGTTSRLRSPMHGFNEYRASVGECPIPGRRRWSADHYLGRRPVHRLQALDDLPAAARERRWRTDLHGDHRATSEARLPVANNCEPQFHPAADRTGSGNRQHRLSWRRGDRRRPYGHFPGPADADADSNSYSDSHSCCRVKVSLTSPVNGTSITSGQPVQVTASATSSHSITGWRIYANNVNVASAGAGNTLNTQFNLAAGSYTVVVKVWDSTGAMGQQSVSITVGPGTPPPGTPRVSINSPASGATLASPLVLSATFSNGGVPQYMKVWIDGVARYTAKNVVSITTPPIALTSGTHKITVQAYNGTLYSSSETITAH